MTQPEVEPSGTAAEGLSMKRLLRSRERRDEVLWQHSA